MGDERATPEPAFEAPPIDVKAELARLLASDKISRNINTSRFLRYVVEETLAGRGDRLKAFSIATQALGRSDDFNPQSDSIVRVQAVRVRAQLDDYYAGPGAEDALRITLPKGSYQPRFEPAPPSKPAEVETEIPALPPAQAPASAMAAPTYRPVVMAAGLLLGLLLLALIAFETMTGSDIAGIGDAPPVLAIGAQVTPPTAPFGPAADRIVSRIVNESAGGEDVRIQRASAGTGGGDYALEAHFTGAGPGAFDVDFTLTERRSRDVIWSKAFANVPDEDRDKQEAIANTVAAVSADMGGALLSDLYRRLKQAGAAPTGTYCRLIALNFMLLRREEGRPIARDCLERQIAREPDDLRSLALLSSFLVVSYMEKFPDSRGVLDVQRALQMARRAYDLKPGGLVALAALFYARFADKRYEDAFAFAPLLLEKNDNSLLVMLRLGRAFVSRARYEEGVAQLERMENRMGSPQPAATAYLALAALMRNDDEAVTRYTGRESAEQTPLGLLLGMIDCQRRGDSGCFAARQLRLKTHFPEFFDDPTDAFGRYGLAPSIVQRLNSELPHLGWPAPAASPQDAGAHVAPK